MLLPQTAAQFADRVNPDRRYVDELEARVERVRARYGFDEDRDGEIDVERERAEAAGEPTTSAPAQMRLAI